MKKTGLFLLLCLAVAALAQEAKSGSASTPAGQATPQGTLSTPVSFPIVQLQTPTSADLYCAGFISPQLLPDANFVSGGLHSPHATKFVNGEIVYLAGQGYQTGQEYAIVRELRDINEYEVFSGQHAMVKAAGQPYAEVGRVRIVDTRSKMAIAQVEFSCDPVNPGDIAIPFVEKPAVSFHPPTRFDRLEPASGKVGGRILLARDFDTTVGTGAKVYMNVGANQGLKVGDYLRAVRTYESDLKDPVDALSFKASTSEETQKRPPSIEPHMFTGTKGPTIHVADLPRRAVGEIVVLGTTPTSATGMIVFALEDVHVGDGVELDQQ